jgi:L-rhamnose mutarotase
MQRVCFISRVRPDVLDEYRRRHQHIWPDMTDALRQSGWANYSLFLTEDGLLVGYLETDDFDAARARMAQTEVNARWQAEMKQFFATDGDQRPDEGFLRLPEIFHLD